MDKTAFGEFLASLRNEHNLTQEQVAEKINVNYKTISKWECGNCFPDLQTLVKLAKIYNVSLYELTIEYKKIRNPFISKNNIKKIINKESKKQFFIFNFVTFIFILLTLVFSLYCCIYTINNFNQIQIYEINSADENFVIKGMYIKEHDIYYLAITATDIIKSKNSLSEYYTKRLKYSLQSNNSIIEKNEVLFDDYHQLHDILSDISFLILDKPLNDIENLYINIELITEKNVIITKKSS